MAASCRESEVVLATRLILRAGDSEENVSCHELIKTRHKLAMPTLNGMSNDQWSHLLKAGTE